MSAEADTQRIIFTLPANQLTAIDKLATEWDVSRSQLLRTAVEHFLEQQQQQQLRESLREAYQEYAATSLELSEEFFAAEQEAWDKYAPWEAEQ
jgi:CopG family transcriptional regulator / antitoxin EndoAI